MQKRAGQDQVRLSPAGGVRLEGCDLIQPLALALKAVIDKALLDHHIVVFPAQSLTREQQFAFAANFGEVEIHGGHRGEVKRPDVAHVITNLDEAGNPTIRVSSAANYHWHTDKPYHPAPPMLTMLRAVEVPSEGGATEFANMAMAYDVLPAAMKRRIAGMRVVFRPAFDPAAPAVDHPLVRTHPESGRRSLYLGNHATGVVGLPESEGRSLLQELLDHVTQRGFVFAHHWRAGDLVLWDNRCLLHRVVADDGLRRHRRIMHRSVVRGTVPF